MESPNRSIAPARQADPSAGRNRCQSGGAPRESEVSDEVDGPFDAFKRWMLDKALPLWASAGWDATERMFEERLGFDSVPDRAAPRRVMVQARQIGVFATASRHGWFDGRDIALAAGRTMVERFWADNARGGWVFARKGNVADERLDLYAHAFVLFALAGLMELTGGREGAAAVGRTLAVLDGSFKDARAGGFWDGVPRPDPLRRQNPHMHLLEAFLALHDATGEGEYLDRATALVDLARTRFMDPTRGVLREYFDEQWRVVPCPGQGSVEPGHLFEWCWLLRRFEAKTGAPMGDLVGPMFAAALRYGTDRGSGRVIDEIGEDGGLRRASTRAWSHAEAIKCLAMEYSLGTADTRPQAAAVLDRLQRVHCPPRLGGGWVDHVDAADAAISAFMPASTLYHLMGALVEADRCFRPRSPAGTGRARAETERSGPPEGRQGDRGGEFQGAS